MRFKLKLIKKMYFNLLYINIHTHTHCKDVLVYIGYHIQDICDTPCEIQIMLLDISWIYLGYP